MINYFWVVPYLTNVKYLLRCELSCNFLNIWFVMISSLIYWFFSLNVFPYFLELLSSQYFPQEICFQQNFFQQLMKHTWRSLFSFIIDDQLLLSCLLGMTSVKNAFFRALPELFGTKCIVGLFLHKSWKKLPERGGGRGFHKYMGACNHDHHFWCVCILKSDHSDFLDGGGTLQV